MIKTLLLFLAIPFNLTASVICVDDDNLSATQNGTGQYPYISIASAIANAADYDTIKVAAGSYSRIDNMGKPLSILGGYVGGTSAIYNSGAGGDFNSRSSNPSLTIISGGIDSVGVTLTRFTFDPFTLLLDNFTVNNSSKGIVCDVDISWPHVDSVTISNNIIENNGQAGVTTIGAGIFLAGNHQLVTNNIVRNNRGGRGPGISGNFTPTDSVVIEGNLVTNNTGYDDHAGGIYLGGHVTLTGNTISGNHLQNSYGWGGGVLILGVAQMSFNIIRDNYCPTYGGAVFVDEGGIAYMDHELIYHNSTGSDGAGIAVDNSAFDSSHIYVTNCTIANNYSPGPLVGNAIYLDNSSFCTLKNCIISGNGDDFFINPTGGLTVSFTLSDEGFTGQGNFTADPLFADTVNGDFHLKSTAGRYDPATTMWVMDLVHSTAIDAGDSSSSYSNEPSPNGGRINLGNYGNTIYASKSASTGIGEVNTSEAEIIVNPNPFLATTTINRNRSFHDATFTLYNLLGKIVATETNISGRTIVLKRNSLSAGIYFLNVTEDDKVAGTSRIAIVD